MSNTDDCLSQQEDEKKNKKKQSPVDDRPTVPSPSEAMLNNGNHFIHIYFKCFINNESDFLIRTNTNLKDNDFYKTETAFGLLDRDSDGHVTPAELQFMLRNLGIEVSDELIADLIKDASRTGNGLIDENEFMQWVTKIQALQGMDVSTSGGDSEEEITRDLLAAFKVFDRDDNGYITRDELRSALEMIGEPVTDAQLNQVLALGDIDHDGRIDYEGKQ
ncbi:unnamed protein product [Danaus chrysippus]|uniref:(African queen) hypothetical protein n=1 Tax=Danaus chrysippus TaxID=151541 RepID=A0A8J2VRK0_9NEOP|nr:unnamed protein product [Danaus chrysippus]